ncbi:unnamed protein product [Dicrocoelium dendriticum]|nr:unnamed protein product [Dicrocoelium dendriticum]
MTLQSLGNTWVNQILKEASALALSYFCVASNCAHQASSSIIQRVINDLSTIKDFTRATQLGCSPSIDKPCIIYSDRSFQRDFSSASPHTLNRVDVSRMTSLDLQGFGCSPGGELSAYLSYFSANHRLSCNARERASLLPTQPKHSGNSQHCTQVICGRAQLGSEADCGRSVYQAGPDFSTDPKTPIASTSNPKAQSHCGSWLQIFPERVLSCADNIAMDCCIEAMQLARLQRLQLQEVVDLINSSGCTASALLSAVSDYSTYRLRCADSTVRTDLPETAPGAEIMSLFDFLLSRFSSTVNNP